MARGSGQQTRGQTSALRAGQEPLVPEAVSDEEAHANYQAFCQAKLNHTLLQAPDSVARLAQALKKYKVEQIAVDFETASHNGRYGAENGRLRLIQIGVVDPAFPGGRKQYLIDCDQLDPTPLKEIFADPKIEKLIHWSPFEQLWAHAKLGVQFHNVHDTGLALQSVHKELERWLEEGRTEEADKIFPGWREKPKASLAQAARLYLGIDLPKELQSSDWGGELSEAQLNYAAIDVALLPDLAHKTKALAQKMAINKRIDWRTAKARDEARDIWQSRQEIAAAETAQELEHAWSGARERINEKSPVLEEIKECFLLRRRELSGEDQNLGEVSAEIGGRS